jgi:outer membrane protein OmpA-like peptidoglycan-associated protein
VLRRTRILPDGRQVVLFDDTDPSQPVEIDALPRREARTVELDQTYTDRDLREALLAAELEGLDRRFSLAQIRDIEAVRNLVPALELEAITFPSGSAAIPPQEAEELAAIGTAMEGAIDENPGEVFLIEGYTDAVGAAPYNLALSDRRAESVALALTEYFDVPPENLVIQGYGETNLKVQTQEAERANRRVTVRRITPLLQSAQSG